MDISWTRGKPRDLKGLFEFYHEYVKVLYSVVQARDKLPQETLFELNAALDHISRRWIYDEPEASVVSKAYGHFKRSCFDIFKIKVRDTGKEYEKLLQVDTSIIEGGRFDGTMHKLFHQIQTEAAAARQAEGSPDDNVPAFDLWQAVYVKCWKFEKDFLLHQDIPWAKKKGLQGGIKGLIVGAVVGWAIGHFGDWMASSIQALASNFQKRP